jgi:hypothetical protein
MPEAQMRSPGTSALARLVGVERTSVRGAETNAIYEVHALAIARLGCGAQNIRRPPSSSPAAIANGSRCCLPCQADPQAWPATIGPSGAQDKFLLAAIAQNSRKLARLRPDPLTALQPARGTAQNNQNVLKQDRSPHRHMPADRILSSQ